MTPAEEGQAPNHREEEAEWKHDPDKDRDYRYRLYEHDPDKDRDYRYRHYEHDHDRDRDDHHRHHEPHRPYRPYDSTSMAHPAVPMGSSSSNKPPLRAIHVSLAMMPAGIDKWLTGLIRHTDPRRLKFLRCVVTSDQVDLRQLARTGIPVEIGGRESIRRASADCDVLIISDPGERPDWVAEVRSKLNVFVAHGDGPWTRDRMEMLAPAIHHVIAVSNRVVETVCQGFPTTMIPNGVDPVHLTRSRPRHEVRASMGFGPDDFVLGYVGRFSPEKNPGAAIEAVTLLPPRFKALWSDSGCSGRSFWNAQMR